MSMLMNVIITCKLFICIRVKRKESLHIKLKGVQQRDTIEFLLIQRITFIIKNKSTNKEREMLFKNTLIRTLNLTVNKSSRNDISTLVMEKVKIYTSSEILKSPFMTIFSELKLFI